MLIHYKKIFSPKLMKNKKDTYRLSLKNLAHNSIHSTQN